MLSHVQLSVAPLSMEFSRQGHRSKLSSPTPGIFLTQGSNPCQLHLLQREADSLPLVPPGTTHLKVHWLHVTISAYSDVAAAKSLQSCLTLCDPIDSSPPGSSVHGILQARILEWVAISFSNACMHAKSLQSCLTLCDPMDSSPPGPSVHGIL